MRRRLHKKIRIKKSKTTMWDMHYLAMPTEFFSLKSMDWLASTGSEARRT